MRRAEVTFFHPSIHPLFTALLSHPPDQLVPVSVRGIKMGNSQSCCIYSSHRSSSSSAEGGAKKGKNKAGKRRRLNGGHLAGEGQGFHPGDPRGSEEYLPGPPGIGGGEQGRDESVGNLQHISEREPDDWEEDPSLHPTTETLFMEKSKQAIQSEYRRGSQPNVIWPFPNGSREGQGNLMVPNEV